MPDRHLERIRFAAAGEEIEVAAHLWAAAGPAAPAVVCVHGLSRNARDFDCLAHALAPRFRVACIDMPGRGDSGWFQDSALYAWDTYVRVACAVIDSLGLGAVHWVGTSMGGRIGLRLASSEPQRVRSLVLNDVGAELDGSDLVAQRGRAAALPTFATQAEALAWCRTRFAEFGIRTEARWQHLARTSFEPDGHGRWRARFDPKAVSPNPPPAVVSLWEQYDAVRCPVLVLRGAQSRLLSADTCRRMTERGPRASWIEIPGTGHAPDLEGDDRIGPVARFIERTERLLAANPESP
jgi:pimeloyl-ACP methyl ester carboxylesterase